MGQRLDAYLDDVDARLDWVETAIARLRDSAPETDATTSDRAATAHVVFAPSPSGYALVERVGVAPAAGETVELPGLEGCYRVVRSARSPLPDDRRRCVYLEII